MPFLTKIRSNGYRHKNLVGFLWKNALSAGIMNDTSVKMAKRCISKTEGEFYETHRCFDKRR